MYNAKLATTCKFFRKTEKGRRIPVSSGILRPALYRQQVVAIGVEDWAKAIMHVTAKIFLAHQHSIDQVLAH